MAERGALARRGAERWAAAVGLLWIGLMAARAPWPEPAREASARCPRWVRVVAEGREARWICGPPVAVLAACPGPSALRTEDTLRIVATGTGCRSLVEPTPAGVRLFGGGRLDVNQASAGALVRIPGVGPATAAAIVAGRPYASLDELARVRGIGPIRRRRLRRHLRLGPAPLLWPSCASRDRAAPGRP